MIVVEAGTRARIGGVIAVAALASAGIVFFGGGSVPQAPPPQVARAVSGSGAVEVVTVHVAGAVANPGLVGVAAGSRVADAIAAAGGVASDGDLSAINLAATVGDGDQIVVPPKGNGSGPVPGVEADGKVRINAAAASDLEALPGVGPVLAQRIVEYRETHGPFVEVEDLLDVPGIGEAKLASLRESVSVP